MIIGKVIAGEAIGRTLGYPTANLDVAPARTELASGIYAAHTIMEGITYQSALVIDEVRGKVEVHLLDQDGNYYGKNLKVDALTKISDHVEISSMNNLIEKIEQDIVLIREYFADK